MRSLSRLRAAARNLLRRDDVERDLDDELAAYVDLLAAEKVRAGLGPAEARRRALVEAGGVEQTKEHVRDARAGVALERVKGDIGHALRGLRRSPGFTFAAIATLAIGIGLNSALFTLVYSVLARPLPVRDAGEVVNVYQRIRRGAHGGREVRGNTSFLSYAEYQEYAKVPAFASSAAYHSRTLTVPGVGSGAIESELVTCAYFRALRVRIVLGRDFTDDECAHVGAGAVAVISHTSWLADYGGDSAVVGRLLRVNGLPVAVVGIGEPGFTGIAYKTSAMWLPLTMQPALDHGRDSILVHREASWLVMAARIAPGATIDEARAQVQVTGRRLDAAAPGRLVETSVARGAYVNFPNVSSEGALPILLTLLLGFTIVAMACANVVNLFLARGLARRRELAIRLAIGASRSQLVQQLVIESALVALAGAALGMTFVLALPRALRSLGAIAEFQLDASPDARIVAYVFFAAIVCTLLVGLVPALQTTSLDLASAFKGNPMFGRRTLRPSRLRAVVVGIQLGGSALLLAMAGLFIRSAQHAIGTDPGYATRNVVAFALNAGALGYDSTRARVTYAALIDRARRYPGTIDVALAGKLPLLATNRIGVTLPADRGTDRNTRVVDVVTVSGSYFHTMGMRIIRGATFDSTALALRGREAVISAAMASLLWPGIDAVGQEFVAADQTFKVVGIASDAAVNSLGRMGDAVAYLEAATPLEKRIVVRTSGSPAALIAELPRAARAIDPQLVVTPERFEERLALVLLPARLVAGATATLGGLALILAAIGVAGVVSFGLGQRRHEVAVRLAVGATGHQVVALMMRQATRPIVVGMACGLVLALGLGQLAREFLFGVSALDPSAYGAMLVVLASTALLATYLPSRRAARIDPASTLREDA